MSFPNTLSLVGNIFPRRIRSMLLLKILVEMGEGKEGHFTAKP